MIVKNKAQKNTSELAVKTNIRPRTKSVFNPLPTDPNALCRLPQLVAHLGLGRSRIYQLVQEGALPRPIKLGRSSLWRVGPLREAAAKLGGEAR